MKFPALAFLSTLAMITCDAATCGENFRRISASACAACGTNGGTIDAEQAEGNAATFCKCAIDEKVVTGPICQTCPGGKVKSTRVEVNANNVGTCDAAPTVENGGLCGEDHRRDVGLSCVACGTNGGTLTAETSPAGVETFCKCSVDQKVIAGLTCAACDSEKVKAVAFEVKDASVGVACDAPVAPVVSDKCGADLSLFKNSSDCLKISVFSDLACVTAVDTLFVKKNTEINFQSIDFTFNCTGDALQVYYTSASTTASASFAFTSCHELKGIGEVDFSAQFVGECTSDPVSPPSTSSAVTVNAGLASSFLVFAMLQY